MDKLIGDLLNGEKTSTALKNHFKIEKDKKIRKLKTLSAKDFTRFYRWLAGFSWLIFKFMASGWLFTTKILPRLGFEKTVVLLLTLLFISTAFKNRTGNFKNEEA
jgi:hypothetical protein